MKVKSMRDLKFELGEEWLAFPYTRRITIPIDEIEDLASLIHEINELEIQEVLESMGFSGWEYFEITANIIKMFDQFCKVTDTFKLAQDYTSIDITHILSPYGFCSLIGHVNSKLKW